MSTKYGTRKNSSFDVASTSGVYRNSLNVLIECRRARAPRASEFLLAVFRERASRTRIAPLSPSPSHSHCNILFSYPTRARTYTYIYLRTARMQYELCCGAVRSPLCRVDSRESGFARECPAITLRLCQTRWQQQQQQRAALQSASTRASSFLQMVGLRKARVPPVIIVARIFSRD